MQVVSMLSPGRSVYVSAAFGRRRDVATLCQRLAQCRIDVVSSWHLSQSDLSKSSDCNDRLAAARQDLAELRKADVYVVLSQPEEAPMGRGGRHVELGAALAWGIPVVVLGNHEHVFHALAAATFSDAEALVESISSAWATAA